jgi:hypothetical protein
VALVVCWRRCLLDLLCRGVACSRKHRLPMLSPPGGLTSMFTLWPTQQVRKGVGHGGGVHGVMGVGVWRVGPWCVVRGVSGSQSSILFYYHDDAAYKVEHLRACL